MQILVFPCGGCSTMKLFGHDKITWLTCTQYHFVTLLHSHDSLTDTQSPMYLTTCKNNSFIHPQPRIAEKTLSHYFLSHIMRKPEFCLCENKGADQLCSYSAQLICAFLCFRYMDRTIPLLLCPKFQASSYLQ